MTCPASEVIVGALESEENGAAYVFERTAPIDHQWLSQGLGLPSGYVKIAIENGYRNSDFYHDKWCDFP